MHTRHMILIGSALLAGCASVPTNTGTTLSVDPLIEAKNAIVTGDLKRAEGALRPAPSSVGATDARSQARALLLAELALRRGNDAEARRFAAMVHEVAPNDHNASEILGKIALRGGRFGEARQLFESARVFATRNSDCVRACDLLHITAGLAAYAAGNITEARAEWAQVRNTTMRGSFGRAYASVVGQEGE